MTRPGGNDVPRPCVGRSSFPARTRLRRRPAPGPDRVLAMPGALLTVVAQDRSVDEGPLMHTDSFRDDMEHRQVERTPEDAELAHAFAAHLTGPARDGQAPGVVEVPEWLVHRILAESVDQPLPRPTWDALDALCCPAGTVVSDVGDVTCTGDGS